jgi:hypothetical protein
MARWRRRVRFGLRRRSLRKMIANNENEMVVGKLRNSVAVVLCLAHILTVCGMAYQSPWKADHFALINFSVWLSPALIPFLARRSVVLTIICAIPISVIFCARMYFVWQLYSLGTNSGGQKGDFAWLATTAMGALSIGVLALWLLSRAVSSIANLAFRSSKKSHGVSK